MSLFLSPFLPRHTRTPNINLPFPDADSVFIGDAMVTTWNPKLDTWKVLAGVPGCTRNPHNYTCRLNWAEFVVWIQKRNMVIQTLVEVSWILSDQDDLKEKICSWKFTPALTLPGVWRKKQLRNNRVHHNWKNWGGMIFTLSPNIHGSVEDLSKWKEIFHFYDYGRKGNLEWLERFWKLTKLICTKVHDSGHEAPSCTLKRPTTIAIIIIPLLPSTTFLNPLRSWQIASKAPR